MKKYFYNAVLITLWMFLTGCTYHWHTVPQENDNIETNSSLIGLAGKTCIFFDESQFVKFEVHNSLSADDWAYDFGKDLKILGERFFVQYEKIIFFHINDQNSTISDCDIRIYPKVDSIVYTYNKPPEFNADLDIQMSTKVHEKSNGFYEKVYKSENIKIDTFWLNELNRIAREIYKWVLPTLEKIILDANEHMEAKR